MRRIAGYEVIEVLGQGGLGEVLKARQPETGRVVVLKEVSRFAAPDYVERSRRVADAFAQMQHPNVARLLGVVEDEGRQYLVQEYVEGQSLAQALRQGPKPPREAAQLVEALAHAIHAVNQQGVIHRNLKPANVLIAADGTPKVIDFDLALPPGCGEALSESGAVVGTPMYMAPEQAAGRAVGPATDVHGLGAVLYQMVAGRPPFQGQTLGDTLTQVISQDPPAPHTVNPQADRALETICLKCLQKDPKRRYATAEALAEDLHRYLQGQSITAAAGARPPAAAAAPAVVRTRGPAWSARRSAPAAGPRPELPEGTVDPVVFTVTTPPAVRPGAACVIDVWAHLEGQRREVLERAREAAGGGVRSQSKGPLAVARGSVLTVRLKVTDLAIDEPEDTIWWEGEIGNANVAVRVPEGVAEGPKQGVAAVLLDGLQIARVHFLLHVGAAPAAAPEPSREERHRKAFASYATADRDEVLPRIQGLQKAAPGLEVFLDVMSLRSGQYWERELWQVIPKNDVFYLFWSDNARRSPWVEKEWRCALETKGLDFIDPVPLASPVEVPPPAELAGKHFNDWTLAFLHTGEARRREPVFRRFARRVRNLVGWR